MLELYLFRNQAFSKNSAHNEYRDIVFKINNIHSKVPALEKILFLDNI